MSSPAPPRRQLSAETASHPAAGAPPRCAPRDVRARLAHLVVRQPRPHALPGIGLPVAALQRHTASVQGSVAATEFSALVGKVRSGPAPWWPTRLPVLDGLVNTAELAVHLEDMVRAQPDWEPSV